MTSTKPVALVVGASRGIGRQIAIDLGANGYAVVVAAKSVSDPSKLTASTPFPPDPNSSDSTVTTVAREIVEAGGEATALQVDVRSAESIQGLVDGAIKTYGHIDVLVYNPGAIFWAPVAKTPLRRFQLMQHVNPEGLYAVVQAALPHLAHSSSSSSSSSSSGAGGAGGGDGRGRIVVVSPPIYSRFFRGKTAYAMGKVGMSVLTKGLAMDFDREGSEMAITSLWPAVAIQSAATEQFTRADPAELNDLRLPTVFSDAVLAILKAPRHVVNGQLLLDEDFLREHAGVADFAKYSLVPGAEPRRIMPARLPDLTVEEQNDEGKRYDSSEKENKAKL
jgi:NAD(P)-dependent dehydrogenase (short-subunit alcohol dehydrogenase family)